jgi:hypothetical protein
VCTQRGTKDLRLHQRHEQPRERGLVEAAIKGPRPTTTA